MSDPVSAFLEAVRTANISQTDVWAADAVVDATVPHWRFSVTGSAAIKDVFGQWYADPAAFAELTRTQITDGELIQFQLTWTERGVPHAAHQAHIIRVVDGRIVGQTVFCGGRWTAGLLAEMAEAAG